MCFITLLMTRTQSTFFCNWTNRSLCNDWPFCPSSYSETERAIWSLHVLALVMWHHVPLYCDVVSGGEEMKCLEAMWETCVCVCPRACTWWGFRRKVSKYESIWPRACICVWSWYQLGLKCLHFGTYPFLIIAHIGSLCEQLHPKCIKWFCETGITIPHFRHQTPC